MIRNIKILFMDVDGTLTNGKIYMGEQGELFKAFDVKDGYGIHEMLPQHGIIPVIITARTSKILQNRAAELDITEVYQGKHEKLETMLEIMDKFQCSPAETAYIGDDLSDLPCMRICGFRGCPADAAKEIQAISDFVSSRNGGSGAVRDFIEWLVDGYGF